MSRLLFALCALMPVFGQDTGSQQPASTDWPTAERQPPRDDRRYTFGGRFHYFPDNLFSTSTATASTTKPIADYTYVGGSHGSKMSASAVFEFRINAHLSIGTEVGGRQAKFSQVTTIRSGARDPNSTADNRPITTQSQNTRANYLEVPVLARYYGLFSRKYLSHVYWAGGLAYRHIGTIRTGTDITKADGTTDYNEVPATPQQTNQAGFVAGFGLRFIDELKVRTMPEIRYTYWQGTSFQGPSYRSNQSQLEFGLGFSF